MARIRSVHPGIYTDEAWASVSIAARWLGVGLMTEADDNGVFEWKPLQIKMRLFPADNIDVPALLAELSGAGVLMAYEAEGKRLGALKNFCKFQRPRKPKAWFPITAEVATFVAQGDKGTEYTDAESEPPQPQKPTVPQKSELAPLKSAAVPQKPEKSPQMEDGGGSKVSDANASSSPEGDKAEYPDAFEVCWKAYPHVRGRSSKTKSFGYWRRISADRRARLQGAIARYAKEGREPREDCGAPAMERWLRDSRFLDWLEEDRPPASSWAGPADLREAFVAAHGEDFTRAYLDPCAWQDVPTRVLIPRTGTAAAKLRTDAAATLRAENVEIGERAA